MFGGVVFREMVACITHGLATWIFLPHSTFWEFSSWNTYIWFVPLACGIPLKGATLKGPTLLPQVVAFCPTPFPTASEALWISPEALFRKPLGLTLERSEPWGIHFESRTTCRPQLSGFKIKDFPHRPPAAEVGRPRQSPRNLLQTSGQASTAQLANRTC